MENLPENNLGPTGWENMDIRSEAPASDAKSSQEQQETEDSQEQQETAATPEEYEKFAKDNFAKLLDALENPLLNTDDSSEQGINAQLAITVNLLEQIDHGASQQNSSELFDSISAKYQAIYDEQSIRGTHVANTSQRLLNATETVHGQFDKFIASQRA